MTARALLLVASFAVAPLFAQVESPPTPEVLAIITRAGNASDDATRLEILKELPARTDLSPTLRAETEKMISLVQAYVASDSLNKPIYYFIDFVGGKGGKFWKENPLGDKSPFRPMEGIYRARNSIWCVIQTPFPTEKANQTWMNGGWKGMDIAHRAYPENRIVAMYMGKPTPWVREYPDDPQAPEWANAQRRALEGVTDIIHWWIDHRQRPDGEFGGQLGDDVEMWRWWVPVLLGFQDPKVEASQEALSRASMKILATQGGYVRMSDVEHSSEDFTDSVTPMLHLQPDNAEWVDHALTVEKFLRNKWMGRNEKGHLQIKNIFMGSAGVKDDPEAACETPYHARISEPLVVAWLRTDDPTIAALMTEWMPTWVAATASAESGKPAGIIPAGIRWPDGLPQGPSPQWWLPAEKYTLYNFPNAMSLLTDTLLATWHKTRDAKYLEPIRSMAAICLANKDASLDVATPGTAEWAAAMLMSRGSGQVFMSTVAKYTMLTGDHTFAPLLAAHAPYENFRLTRDRGPLLAELKVSADAVSRNFEAFTSEVRWTDRVNVFPGRWFGFENRLPELAGDFDSTFLFSMTTGNSGSPLVFPTNAVRWLTPSREIAAFVTDSGKDKLTAELYHFGAQPRAMAAELLLLAKGAYTATLRSADDEGKVLSRADFTVDAARTTYKFTLPPRQLCRLEIAPRS